METPRKFITAVNLLTLFCRFIKLSMLRNTRSKLIRIIYRLRL